MSAGTGYLLENRASEAGSRFDALSTLFDPWTFAHLDAVGTGPGWRCWEVGAGGPSVPRWMTERVGRAGRVTATDIDVSWLDHDDGYEVLYHDVEHEPPPDAYDLVHARLVLTHLPGRDRALRTMAASLRPGGWVVVEDFDVGLQPRAGLDAPSPERCRANRLRDGFVELLAQRGVDLHFGRSLPSRLRALGLVDVRADAYLPLAMPATLELELANLRQVHAALIAAGFHETELEAHAEGLEHGLLDIATPPLVSAWGRRPTEQERGSATNGGGERWPAS